MPDDLDVLLRTAAQEVAAAVTPAPAGRIRARGDQRRRHALALSAALAAAVVLVGGGSVYAVAGHPGRGGTPGPAGSATSGPQPSHRRHPLTAYATDILGVACASATDCWATGTSYPIASGRPLVERWAGSRWSAVAYPAQHGARIATLTAVSCLGTGDCWATGETGQYPPYPGRALHWDGRSWSWVSFAGPPGADSMQLGRVSCVSNADCWVAGAAGYGASSATGQPDRRYTTLTEHWNGTRWTVVPSPSAYLRSSLTAVSCASSADCWAIGTWVRPHGSGGGTLTEHWNGAAWSRVATPTDNSGTPTSSAGEMAPPYTGFGATMNDLSCAGPACLAVGNGTYDGVPGVSPVGQNLGGSTALAERWTSHGWADVPTPALAGANTTDLLAVSCTSGSVCMAVGYFAPRSGVTRALAERWDGSAWTVVPAPSPAGRLGSQLTAVSCVSPADCWAAGTSGSSQGPSAFLAHWNGSSW